MAAASGREALTYLKSLRRRYRDAPARDLVEGFALKEFAGRIAVVSSFGAEAAIVLHLIAQAAPRTPVLFINTGKMFGETLRYRDLVQSRLGLRDVRAIGPDLRRLREADARGVLHSEDPDACCLLRKVLPLSEALEPFDAWITGRKRFHSDERARLERIEFADGKFKLNPLADWSKADLDAYITTHDLPAHPLERQGFLSIGCMPCTARVAPGEDARSGRWRGHSKSECGIHDMGAALKRARGDAEQDTESEVADNR